MGRREEGRGEEEGEGTTGKLEISWKYLSILQVFIKKQGFLLCLALKIYGILKQISLVIFTCSK